MTNNRIPEFQEVRLRVVDMVETRLRGNVSAAMDQLEDLESQHEARLIALDLLLVAACIADIRGDNYSERLDGVRALIRGDRSHLIGSGSID
jgi:hypothetical protein